MRISLSVATIVVIGTILATPLATAQTYDPSYPVCLHMFGGFSGGDYYECRYTSMAQCNASASGRAALCVTNPYFAPARKGPRRDRPRSNY